MLQITGLQKKFNPGTPNEVYALKGISLTIEEGEFVVVIGTNGSGKSTLLNAVAGTFFADQGKIMLDGDDITKWPEHKRARHIGRVFQNPFSGTAPTMSIAENLALASRRGACRGLGFALSSRVVKEFKDKVRSLNMGLESRLDNPIGTLSGGQRQALTLLMASVVKPKLLLLDEHTAALDPKTADQVIRITEEIVTAEKLTTMMVTHSMQQAVNLGSRLVMMYQGRVTDDLSGADKQRLRLTDLFARFDEIKRREELDETAAEMLRACYV